MKILFDINIILDVLLNRKDFVNLSATLLGFVENKRLEGYLCATSLTTIDYLIAKSLNRSQARIEIKKLLTLFQIAEVNHKVLRLSVESEFKDFEDAVQYYSAECLKLNGLVTRNLKDYKTATLPVYSPDELWHIIQTGKYDQGMH
ncbi:PIN domain-containing protein [Candidatus Venteria ishoeyi]|uniref:PIN domain-containing protein n=1 Tax=Candidatus Venteria ishoeyi TaxID=1899563 RepID=A0A1H6F2N2_9GAMM|nr:PIN domain-containing protein [Candidatus Venteria ishoeyi]MDM8546202.1 PIN domain-containing protein [Candidatus Venteria ishoeyi]SEH04380.1 Uncharacterised protein [Candidatus Venteria ishoeyi]